MLQGELKGTHHEDCRARSVRALAGLLGFVGFGF